MKNKSFFWSEKATNADIVRHREKEQELRELIAESEADGDERLAQAYRHLLNQLLASKAEVVSKLGKKG